MVDFHDRRDGHTKRLPEEYESDSSSSDWMRQETEDHQSQEQAHLDDDDFFSGAKCDNCGSYGMVVSTGSKSLCPDCANSTRKLSEDEKADRRTLGYED